MYNHNHLSQAEGREMVELLRDAGHGALADILMGSGECMTRKSFRLNKSALARATGMTAKEIEDTLAEVRTILADYYDGA